MMDQGCRGAARGLGALIRVPPPVHGFSCGSICVRSPTTTIVILAGSR
jgi:hypothetical protein